MDPTLFASFDDDGGPLDDGALGAFPIEQSKGAGRIRQDIIPHTGSASPLWSVYIDIPTSLQADTGHGL